MNFENQSKKSKYVVIAIVTVLLIILIGTGITILSLSSNSTDKEESSNNQISMSENITTETTTTSSSTTISTTTTSNTTTSTTTSVDTTTSTTSTVEVTTVKETDTEVTQSVESESTPEDTTVEKTSETESTSETTQTTTEEVTTAPETTTVQVETTPKSNEELADEVIRGLWGNGTDRKQRLTDAGYDYSAVQSIVNELAKNFTPVSSGANIENAGTSYVKNFSRGTYYAYGGPRCGGSGRQLIDCSYGDGNVKGSIASSYLYYNYGYNYNGKRTMVYLEVAGYPSMAGYYYLDDCDAGNPEVIDFFYLYNSNCQFQYQGVVSVDCYIVTY